MPFQLAACAEMLWQDKPIHWRAVRLHEMGFGVGLWNWPEWDLDALEATGATFTIMNCYLQGRLTATQALVSCLTAQLTENDVPFIAGEWSIFSHGIVTGLGEARFKRSSTKSPFVFVIDTDPYPSTEPRGTW